MTVQSPPRPSYEEDFYRWTQDQAHRLRAQASLRRNEPIDWTLLAEEVEDLGRSARNTCESMVELVIDHLLKLEHAADRTPEGHWRGEIAAFRATLDKTLTPSLRNALKRSLGRRYEIGKRLAIRRLERDDRSFAAKLPDTCPYGWREIVEDWYPGE
jgi:hypothetical protein